MTKEEREILRKAIEKTNRKYLRSQKTAFNYLVKLGTITEKGNARKPYNVVNV